MSHHSPVISHQASAKSGGRSRVYCLLFTVYCLFPLVASAQAYVPVIDINMEEVFPEIMANAEDSIRNIIAGPEPGETAIETCVRKESDQFIEISWYDPDMQPPEGGPWYRAYQTAQESGNQGFPNPEYFFEEDHAPTEIGTPGDPPGEQGIAEYGFDLVGGADPKMLSSVGPASLRCLLMASIEWQKLALNLQIHAMLRDYIAQAQNYLLTKQLLSKVAAANQEWQKRGLETCTTDADGNVTCTDQPVYMTNTNVYITQETKNEVLNISNQVTNVINNPNAPNGSLRVCAPYAVDTARAILINNRAAMEDPSSLASNFTSCTSDIASDPNAPFATQENQEDYFDAWGGNNTGTNQDGAYAFEWFLRNPQDTPRGVRGLLADEAQRRVQAKKDLTNQELDRGQGFDGGVCAPGSQDPYCVYRTRTTPGAVLQDFATFYATQGDRQSEQANAAFELAGESSAMQSQDILAGGGLSAYQTKELQETDISQVYNFIPQDFYNAIDEGYWNTPDGTKAWAKATMLMIYDTMAQNQTPNYYQGINDDPEQPDGLDFIQDDTYSGVNMEGYYPDNGVGGP